MESQMASTDRQRVRKWAVMSRPRKLYRYLLGRAWNHGPTICFVMLNPSTADHQQNDRTLNRCIKFAERDGYGSLVLVNLFALRSPHPRDLKVARASGTDPVGPRNDQHLAAAAAEADRVVVAWGRDGSLGGRDQAVVKLLLRSGIKKLWCLGTTKDGYPCHPLRRPASQRMIRWNSGARSKN